MAGELQTWPGSGLPSGPAVRAAAVTPSDTLDLSFEARALYIGGAGNVYLDTIGGDSNVGFIGLVAGQVLQVACKRVRATLTTATNIVALA